MYFKNAVEAIGYTPLVETARLSPNRKVRILAKLEGQNVGGSASIKDRVARYMLDKAEQSGKLTKDKVIIEATSGNTGIALAWLGKHRGYKVTIVMPDNVSIERQQLLRIFGAEIVLTKGAYGTQGSIDKAQELAAKDKNYFMPDQFSNPANPLAHYETTAVEILNDFPYGKIDVLIAGIGTGGTIMGVARRLKEKNPAVRIVGVEPPPDDNIQGLKCIGDGRMVPLLDMKMLDLKARVTSQQAMAATKQLLKQEGIFAGLSSGAVIYQAVQEASEMGEGNVVAILADGGLKYLSLDFWTKK